MIDVPATMPLTVPVLVIVATDVLLLLHVPPPVALDRVVLPAIHIVVAPVITAGSVFTVTLITAKQPAVMV